jgi:hypothetical protein
MGATEACRGSASAVAECRAFIPVVQNIVLEFAACSAELRRAIVVAESVTIRPDQARHSTNTGFFG